MLDIENTQKELFVSLQRTNLVGILRWLAKLLNWTLNINLTTKSVFGLLYWIRDVLD